MKKEIVVIALIGILFLLVLGSILASVTFYKEYKDKIEYLEQQTMSGKSRIEGVEGKLDGFKATIDEISSQVKGYSDSIKTLQSTVTLSEDERKNLLAKLEEMKKDLVGIQKDYSSTVVDIRQGIMTLKDELDKMGNKSKDIELGKITVKQDDKKAAAGKKQTAAPAAKSTGSNFGASSVRKVDSY